LNRSLVAALAALALLAPAAASPASPDPAALADLLAASDLFARAPAEFRAEIEVGRIGSDGTSRLEIHRKGPDLELVRFLAPKERGKFLLRRGEDLWFLAPGSRKPVLLAPSYRVYGASLHDLVGLDLARDYRIEGSSEAGGVVTFELAAAAPRAASPRITWVVSRTTRRPLRADMKAASGKVLRVLEFKSWRDAERGVPERLVAKDVVAGGAPLDIRFVAFEPRPVDPRLFDLQDASARAALAIP